jgi:Protein of unknown function (DUF3747)
MRYQNLLQCGLTFSVAFSVAIVSAGLSTASVNAQMTQQELDQNGVVLIASPYQNGNRHQLLIVEQLSRTRACWSEQKTNTLTLINPLLSQFDFSGICGRATDSNGFSIRMGGQDLNWRYSLQVMEKDQELLLIARSNMPQKSAPDFVIGRVGGTTPDFAKIIPEPGWRITRRIANGKLTGHFYLTSDLTLEQTVAAMQESSAPNNAAMPNSGMTSMPSASTAPEAAPNTGFPGNAPTALPPAPSTR